MATALTEAQLATPYREGGWTARQVIHHVADSHINAYVRTKWLLTEDGPTIKAYDEKAWAELPDAAGAPIEHLARAAGGDASALDAAAGIGRR